MDFRRSSHIDFDSGTVIMQPMELFTQRPSPRSLEDMLDLFECRVDVWHLGPAVQILKQIETHPSSSVWAHSAYALLGIVFTYFEMIGKSLNPNSRPQGTASQDFKHGFCDVYPAFNVRDGDRADTASSDIKEFHDRVRNGLYHLGYTKGNLFIHNAPFDVPDDFFVDRRGPDPMYLVNPHQVTRTIVAHFPTFMGRLRDSTGRFDDLRSRFQRFFVEYHGLRYNP
jgi:hypothetical protein